MLYSIQFTSRALRDLKGLDKGAQQRLRTHIDRLASNPIPAGAKKLHEDELYYRIRVGDYRLVCQIDRKRFVVIVVKIGHRKEVYR